MPGRARRSACISNPSSSGFFSDFVCVCLLLPLTAFALSARHRGQVWRPRLHSTAKCRPQGLPFLRVVAEACGGGWGAEAVKVWKTLAALLAGRAGTGKQALLHAWLRRVRAQGIGQAPAQPRPSRWSFCRRFGSCSAGRSIGPYGTKMGQSKNTTSGNDGQAGREQQHAIINMLSRVRVEDELTLAGFEQQARAAGLSNEDRAAARDSDLGGMHCVTDGRNRTRFWPKSHGRKL